MAGDARDPRVRSTGQRARILGGQVQADRAGRRRALQHGNAAYKSGIDKGRPRADRDLERAMTGYTSGQVLATGAMILLLSSDHDPDPARIGWNLGITGNGLAVSVRF